MNIRVPHIISCLSLLTLLLGVGSVAASTQTRPSDTLAIYVTHNPPYASTHPDGTLTGLYIDLIDLVFRQAPVDYAIHLTDSIRPDSLDQYPACLYHAGTWLQHEEICRYSRLLFHTQSAVIYPATTDFTILSDLRGHRVGVSDKAYFVKEMLSYGLFFNEDLVYPYHNLEEAIDLLDSGKCDMIVSDYLLAHKYMADRELTRYSLCELSTLPSLYRLHLGHQASDELVSWLDRRLTWLSMNNKIDSLFSAHFGHPHAHSVHVLKSQLDHTLIILVLLTIVLLCAIYYLRRNTAKQIRSFEEFKDILFKLPHSVDMYVDGHSTPMYRNRQSILLEADQKSDPDHVFVTEEVVRFRYKKRRIKMVLKMDVSELEQARIEATKSSQLKTQFLANTSHDLRSPLNAIVGFAGLISECDNDDEMAEYAEIIELNTNNLLHLIDEIIQLSQLQTQSHVKFTREPYDLYPALHRVLSEYKLALERDHKDVDLRLTTNFSQLVVEAHPGRAHRVLSNILSNACKYTHTGEIHMDCAYEEASQTIILCVTDTGIGMSPDRIHDLFSDKDVHDSAHSDSFGLGLAICKAILEQSHGSIAIESTEGIGTQVRIVYRPTVHDWTPV